MNFIRENIFKIFVMFFVILVLIVGLASCSKKPITIIEQYETMENNMKLAAQKLAGNNNSLLPTTVDEPKSIKLDTLVKNEVIKPMYANEDNNILCSGYVSIALTDDNQYVYRPFLKCGKYYETKTIGQFILDNEEVVTEGDGLYQNGAKYSYRGERPNNYVLLDNKYYRIISINDKKELKLISVSRYDDTVVWDDRYNSQIKKSYGINEFSKSRLRDTLNYIYESSFFSDTTRTYIKPHDICVGKRYYEDNDFSGKAECSVTYPNQKVGLIQANEYLYASIDSGCKTSTSPECSNYNYFMYISADMTTQTACAENSYQIYKIQSATVYANRASASFRVYPVIYLDSSVLYKDGNGSAQNPYILR